MPETMNADDVERALADELSGRNETDIDDDLPDFIPSNGMLSPGAYQLPEDFYDREETDELPELPSPADPHASSPDVFDGHGSSRQSDPAETGSPYTGSLSPATLLSDGLEERRSAQDEVGNTGRLDNVPSPYRDRTGEREHTENSVAPMAFASTIDEILSGAIADPMDVDDNVSTSGSEQARPFSASAFAVAAAYEDDEERSVRGFIIDDVIADAIAVGASDIHLNAHTSVAYTINGDVSRVSKFGEVSPDITRGVYNKITSNVSQSDFATDKNLDASYVVRTGAAKGRRVRLSVGRSFGDFYMVMRVISDRIRTPEELGLPSELSTWMRRPRGLFLMNGPTGSGKSTTLASLVRQVQMTMPKKIITVEKPIEYVYGHVGKALITQREVGPDCRTFGSGLTAAVRELPNIILIGEVRNAEEMDALLIAADTGHLAVSTLHTNSAPETLNRIMAMFSGNSSERARVLDTLSTATQGFANQALVKSKDGDSRFAVHELLIMDDEVRSMIGKGDVRGITDYQMRNESTLDHALARAVLTNRTSVEEALDHSQSPERFEKLLRDM